MRPDRTGDRRHSVADLMTLFAAIILTLATWVYLAGSSGIPIWISYTSVTITLLLALAALTRNPNWAVAMRLLIGLWPITAPYLLRFHAVTPALWTYLTVGTIMIGLAITGLSTRRNARDADHYRENQPDGSVHIYPGVTS